MSRLLSLKFRFFTFISITMLAYVHGYNLNNNYLSPFSMVEEPLSFTTFFEYLTANGLLRFRIPLLFLISGYLFAYNDQRPYGATIRKRFKTLVVPYLLWSALALLFTFLLQQIPFTAEIVAGSRLDQLGDNRPYTEIGWAGVFTRLIIAPIDYPLWFILALFFYNLIYPFIRWILATAPYVWLPFTFLLWLILIQFWIVDGSGLFFFSLGIWLQKKNYSLEKKPSWLSVGVFLILFIGICVIKTFMAFELDPELFLSRLLVAILFKVAVLCGLLSIWYGSDEVVKWCMNKKWFHQISGYAFFIFAAHVPLLPYTMHFATKYFSFLPYHRLTLYLVVPGLIVLFCIFSGSLLKRYLPKFYLLLTGGRGF